MFNGSRSQEKSYAAGNPEAAVDPRKTQGCGRVPQKARFQVSRKTPPPSAHCCVHLCGHKSLLCRLFPTDFRPGLPQCLNLELKTFPSACADVHVLCSQKTGGSWLQRPICCQPTFSMGFAAQKCRLADEWSPGVLDGHYELNRLRRDILKRIKHLYIFMYTEHGNAPCMVPRKCTIASSSSLLDPQLPQSHGPRPPGGAIRALAGGGCKGRRPTFQAPLVPSDKILRTEEGRF